MTIPRFLRTTYRFNGRTYKTTWWQVGDRIFGQRDYVLREGW